MGLRNFGLFCMGFSLIGFPMALFRSPQTPVEAPWIAGFVAGSIVVFVFRKKRRA